MIYSLPFVRVLVMFSSALAVMIPAVSHQPHTYRSTLCATLEGIGQLEGVAAWAEVSPEREGEQSLSAEAPTHQLQEPSKLCDLLRVPLSSSVYGG